MESSKQVRIFGGVVITLAMIYYTYQIYLYADNWRSLSDIQDETKCDQIYSLELWLLSQNVIWLVSLALLLMIIAKTSWYKLLLCFFYLMGPVYMTWTIVAIGYFTGFLACCRSEEDKCTEYYPYYSPAGFITLIIVSMLFSSLITIYLLSIVVQALWQHFRHRLQQYTSLLI